MHRSRIGLAGLAAAIGAVMVAAEPPADPGPSFIQTNHSRKGHGWDGKRRKLKKYMQDHQRPRRRRA